MEKYRPPHKTRPTSSSSQSSNRTFPQHSKRQNHVVDSKQLVTGDSQNQGNEDDDDVNVDFIVGTCPFMCPVEERVQRERLRDLAVFERLDGNPGKTSSSLAVKKFCRSISSKYVDGADVRPVPVLEDTLNYLLSLFDAEGHPFDALHDFVFDRTRSIRQDLSIQNVIGDQPVLMYERIVKFHIVSQYKLQRSTKSSDVSPMHYLNLEQLKKALTSLYSMYETNRRSHPVYENEAEFRSIFVLLHLGSDSQPMGESLSLWFRHIPFFILKSKELVLSRRLLRYFRLGNYRRFLHTVEAEASHLQYYILEPYISEVRAFALACVNYGGYKLHPYPLAEVSKHLLMEEADVESFCKECGLNTSISEAGIKFLPTKQTNFCHPKREVQSYYPLVSERLQREPENLLRT